MVSRLKCEIQPGIGTNDKKRSGSWATVLTYSHNGKYMVCTETDQVSDCK